MSVSLVILVLLTTVHILTDPQGDFQFDKQGKIGYII